MKNAAILFFILFFHSAFGQQTIDKLNANQLKLPKESVNKALYLDGAGQVKSSSTISDTELGYLEGLTDTLVNLLSGKANDMDVVKLTGNQSVDGVKTFTGKLVASSTVNGSIPCPVMTEAERDLFTPVEGDCVYNSDTLKLNIFDGSVWKDVGGAGGISLWLTANPYNVNDIIIESDKIYRCLVAHTSGVFATDLAAAKWTEVSASPVTPYSLNDGGTNKALTAVNGGIVWVDADSFEILSAGVSGQVLQSNGAASPSWVNKSISGKAENASSITLEEIQVSNNQLTQTDTNKHLVETGNTNILANPSFEHSTFSTGWTNALGTFAVESTVVVHGKKSAKVTLSSQALDLSQDSTLYQAQFADGVQGLASVRVKTTVSGIRVCSRQNGVVSSNLCVNVQANGKWGLYKVPFTLGGTSNGIEIDSNSVAVTGDVYFDDAFVGAVDLAADVQSVQKGSLSYAKTTNCAFSTASTSYASFTADTDCPTASVTGIVSSPATKVPGFVLPAGTQGRVFVVGSIYSSPLTSTSGMTGRLRLTDGTNNYGDNFAAYSAGTGSGILNQVAVQAFEFTITNPLAAATTYQLQGLTTNAANTVNVNGADYNIEFYVTVYPSNAGTSTYSSTNADTDWQSCGHTTSSFTGFGTVSAIETQCKREGSDLLMRGKFTSGLPTAVEARVSLPMWNGVQLISAGTSVIPSIQVSGVTGISVSGSFSFLTLKEPSVSYITFGRQDASVAALTKATGSILAGTGSLLSFTARIPISGWENSNIIIGQFNGLESCTNSYECTDTFSAKISSAGVVSDENLDFISGNCTIATNAATCTFRSGVFTVTPNCVVATQTGGGGAISGAINPNGTTGFTAITYNTLGSQVANDRLVICQKQGVDYIGKTAKAVASDQNLRSPGITKGAVCSFGFGGASYRTSCTSSPCTVYNANGCSPTVTRSSASNYVVTFPTNTWSGATYNCTYGVATYTTGTTPPGVYETADKTSTTLSIQAIGSASTDAALTLNCHGTTP